MVNEDGKYKYKYLKSFGNGVYSGNYSIVKSTSYYISVLKANNLTLLKIVMFLNSLCSTPG